MDDLNRRTPSLRFERNLSLDRPYCGFNSQNTVTLLDYLPDRTTDETALYVDAFKKSLSQQSREIIDALEQGIARTVVARTAGLSVYKLNSQLVHMWDQYISGTWIEENVVTCLTNEQHIES